MRAPISAAGSLLLVSLTPAALAQMDEPTRAREPDRTVLDREAALDSELAATALDPGLRARIDAALQARDYAQAEALLLEEVEARPRSAEALRLLGGVFFVQGKAREAAGAYRSAAALAPLDEPSRFTLVMSYVVLGRRDWARPELKALAEASPRNPLYHYWTARLDYDEGQHEAAVDRLLQVIELDPTFLRAWDNLGLNYEALGRFDDAVRSYEEALRLNREALPPSPWPALNLGVLLMKLDRLEESEARLRESVGADPSFPRARYQLGLALDKRGRAEDAILELEEAARLDVGYAEPHFALARLYRRRGQKEKAREALERFQEIKRAQEEE